MAKQIWLLASEFLGVNLGHDYLSIAKFWPANKKKSALNSICSCVLWCIWKFRNSMIFDNVYWTDIKQVWLLILRRMRKWLILYKEESLLKVDNFCGWYLASSRPPFRSQWGSRRWQKHWRCFQSGAAKQPESGEWQACLPTTGWSLTPLPEALVNGQTSKASSAPSHRWICPARLVHHWWRNSRDQELTRGRWQLKKEELFT